MLEGDRGGEQAEGDGLFAEITQELLFLLDYATYEAISMWIKRTLDSLWRFCTRGMAINHLPSNLNTSIS